MKSASPRILGLAPADFILLSFSDSDLATFRAATNAPLTHKPLRRRPPHPVLLPKGRRDAQNCRSPWGSERSLSPWGEGWGEGVFLRPFHQPRRPAPPDLGGPVHRKDRSRHEGHPPAPARRPRLLALRRGGAGACLPQARRDARGAVWRWPRRSKAAAAVHYRCGGVGCARPAARRGRAAKRRHRHLRADGEKRFIFAGGSAAGVRRLSRNWPGGWRLGRDYILSLFPAGGGRAAGRCAV